MQILELKSGRVTINTMENSLTGLNRRFRGGEEWVSDLEDISINIFQSEEYREKDWRKINCASEICGTIANSLNVTEVPG